MSHHFWSQFSITLSGLNVGSLYTLGEKEGKPGKSGEKFTHTNPMVSRDPSSALQSYVVAGIEPNMNSGVK